MKTRSAWKSAAVAGALMLTLLASGCEVQQTEEARLPDVDVSVKDDGNLPKYDVDTADVDVRSETKSVDIPDVDVGTEKKTVEVKVPDVDVSQEKTNIKVPDVDVTMPSEKGN